MLDPLVKKRRFLISLGKQIIYWTSLEKEDALDLLWGKHDILDLLGKKDDMLDLLGKKRRFLISLGKKDYTLDLIGKRKNCITSLVIFLWGTHQAQISAADCFWLPQESKYLLDLEFCYNHQQSGGLGAPSLDFLHVCRQPLHLGFSLCDDAFLEGHSKLLLPSSPCASLLPNWFAQNLAFPTESNSPPTHSLCVQTWIFPLSNWKAS